MQFDAHVNPISATRRAYPYVVILQSDLAQSALDQIVAPLILSDSLPKTTRRLTPIVQIESGQYLVLVPSLTGIRGRDLNRYVCSLASARTDILAAIDYLFFGV